MLSFIDIIHTWLRTFIAALRKRYQTLTRDGHIRSHGYEEDL